MSPAERSGDESHHELRKLPYAWSRGHTPEAQAAYLERAVWALTNSGSVLGAVWFCWSDRAVCWNCQAGDCPAGTSHGLVDVDGNPKPSYHAFARAARGQFDIKALYPDEASFSETDAGRLLMELGRKAAQNRALRARVDLLKKMLASRTERLERVRRSLPFRLWRLLTQPLAHLTRRRAKGSPGDDG